MAHPQRRRPAVVIDVTQFATDNGDDFKPYLRDRRRSPPRGPIPGTPGLEHRIGGLEKADITGNVSYDAENHEHMVTTRAEKVARIANDIPGAGSRSGRTEGDLLVLGWGSTYGAIYTAVQRARRARASRPPPTCATSTRSRRTWATILKRFKKVLIPELNIGQLRLLIRGKYLVDAQQLNKVRASRSS